ncbi:restriction endonuclease [Campylobacter sp. MG1]|uniref:restriction endonuclease n=1 Tax=Campylobacter sp. MG1 TaxID=2976332 RepID=UPI00226D192E|nr:restriction endonuclease [Campylobacter sp. MG1]
MATLFMIILIIFFAILAKYALSETKILKLREKAGQVKIKDEFKQRLKEETNKEIMLNLKDNLRYEIIKDLEKDYKKIIEKLEQENKELKEKLNKQKENYKEYLKNKEQNIKKGQDYEFKIKTFYENLGYKVYPNGYINKKNDKGIDLLAYKNNELHLIQCKCYKNPPKQELIRKFIGDCEVYIKNNQHKLKNKTIYKDFVTSCKNKDYGVIKYLEENKNIINYLIIE